MELNKFCVAFVSTLFVSALVAAAKPSSVAYWEKMLPGVAMPATLRASLSPIERTAIADLYALQIKHGNEFCATTTAAFCKVAGLICEDDDDVVAPSVELRIYYAIDNPNSAQLHHMILTSRNLGFFLQASLVEGATMNLDVERVPEPLRAFLPQPVADAVPVPISANLPKLRQIFNIQEGTNMKTAMDTATLLCEAGRLPEEKRACPTSLEALVDFIFSQVGEDVEALAAGYSSSFVKGSAKVLDFTQRSVAGKPSAVCHNAMFPFQLYFCHVLPETRVFEVTLLSANGSRVSAVGVCHPDTSLWATDHPAFLTLKVGPGTEVCHWAAQDSLVWVPAKH